MNLNRTLLPIMGTLLLAGAFTQAAIEAQDSTIGFEVLSEESGRTPITSALNQNVPATVSWQGDDQIVVTTVGYPNCPVLPASITTSDDVVSINLTAVPGDSDCATSLETFTTVLRLENWNEDQAPQLEVRDERI